MKKLMVMMGALLPIFCWTAGNEQQATGLRPLEYYELEFAQWLLDDAALTEEGSSELTCESAPFTSQQ